MILLLSVKGYWRALVYILNERCGMKKLVKLKFLIVVALTIILCFLLNGFSQNRKLFRAIENNDYVAAKYAVEHGAFIDLPYHLLEIQEIMFTNPTPLISACKNGNRQIVELLLDNGADINRQDGLCGETPLLAALHGTKQNRFSLAKYLIDRGANIYISQKNNSPLWETLSVLETDNSQTIEEGYALFQYLMEHNVDMTLSSQVENPLTFAVHYRNYRAVKYFLEHGFFDIDERDKSGGTALIAAAKYGRLEIAELLLDLGADKLLVDETGYSALDYALENGFYEIVELLSN